MLIKNGQKNGPTANLRREGRLPKLATVQRALIRAANYGNKRPFLALVQNAAHHPEPHSKHVVGMLRKWSSFRTREMGSNIGQLKK